jgi:hypothetical protein
MNSRHLFGIPLPWENSPLDTPVKPPKPAELPDDFRFYQQPFRKGDFGYHVTTKGKIVYQRRKKTFSEADFKRIGVAVILAPVPEGAKPQGLWWIIKMQEITIKLLDIMFTKIPWLNTFEIDPKEVYWSINNFGSDMIRKFADKLDESGNMEAARTLRELNGDTPK